MPGRIDTHCHLLPGVDDGCRNVAESVACARRMVEAGYTHSYCTPHIWPNLKNDWPSIASGVAELQAAYDREGVPLRLLPGGEMHLSPAFLHASADRFVTYGAAGQFALFDFWTDTIPEFFWPSIERIRAAGVTPILAHPERIAAIQNDPTAIDEIASAGILLQGNLECIGEDEPTVRAVLARRWLVENRYFMIGSDLHRFDTLDRRLRGLARAHDLIGEDRVWELTHTHPMLLAPIIDD